MDTGRRSCQAIGRISGAIAKHAMGMRSYSPTALQNYAGCPYKFFLQAIHRLAPCEVPESIDELDPLQRGSLIHEIQFELFERLKAANLLPITRQNLEHVGNTLDEVIGEVARQFYADLAPAIDRVWADGIDSIRVDLREWLRRASEDDSGYVPWRFELSFGLAGSDAQRRDPHSTSKPVDLDCGIHSAGRSTSSNVTRAGTFASAITRLARRTEKAGRSSRAEGPYSQPFMRLSLRSFSAEN